jgi:hypothetical protein
VVEGESRTQGKKQTPKTHQAQEIVAPGFDLSVPILQRDHQEQGDAQAQACSVSQGEQSREERGEREEGTLEGELAAHHVEAEASGVMGKVAQLLECSGENSGIRVMGLEIDRSDREIHQYHEPQADPENPQRAKIQAPDSEKAIQT